jgi:hypothetical protein
MNKAFFTMTLFAMSLCTPIVSQESENSDLENIDSISSFFHQREIAELNKLDNYFTSSYLKDQSNIDYAYKELLQNIIKQINEDESYYTCNLTALVSLAKQDLKRKLNLMTFSKIFRPNLTRYYFDSDTLFVYFDEINVSGKYVDFLSYCAKKDTLLIGYVDTIKETGDFPMFLDCLEIYVDKFDFNNQVHRLIVLIHLMSQSSQWTYEDC